MSSNAMPNEACPTTIPWPTVFFWMVSFAINAAAQSTGRILNLDPDLEISSGQFAFLRSSPILCIFDAMSVVASLVTRIYQSPKHTIIGIREAASRILLHRMDDPEADEDDRAAIRAIQSLKAQRWPRWIGFLLGALPQFVKLFAAQGKSIAVPKALGAMYFASWVIFEIIISIADIDNIKSLHTRTRNLKRPQHRQNETTKILGVARLNQAWTTLAILTHAIIYTGPTWSIYLTFRTLIANTPDSPAVSFILNYIIFPAGLVGFHVPVWGDLLWTPDAENDTGRGYAVLLGTFMHFMVPIAALHIGVPTFEFARDGVAGSDGGSARGRWVVEGSMVLACVSGMVIGLYGSQGRDLGRGVWVLRVLCMVCFPLLYFGAFFEAEGTSVPGWTVMLG